MSRFVPQLIPPSAAGPQVPHDPPHVNSGNRALAQTPLNDPTTFTPDRVRANVPESNTRS
jgi:hypothetical protein